MKIAIRQGSLYHFININDVVRIEASDSGATVYLKDTNPLRITSNLKKIESQLPNSFFKIHRSHIVNKVYISRIIENGSFELELKDRTILPISKTKKSELLKKVKKF